MPTLSSVAPRTPLPHIIRQKASGDRAIITFSVAASHSCFEGHFPKYPIVPGIVQIHWAQILYRQLFTGEPAGAISQLKFMKPIKPDQKLVLEIIDLPQNNRFVFNYSLNSEKVSSGQVETTLRQERTE